MQVLIAFDGSAYTEASLYLGAQLAQAGARLTVLTVVKRNSDELLAGANATLARASEILSAAAPEPKRQVRIGHPAREILLEAREGDYDLVVVGRNPAHKRLIRRIRGSTALSVADRAPCSVMVVKGQIGPIRRILMCDSGFQGPSVLSRFTVQLAEMLGEPEITVLHVMSQISAGPGVRGVQLRAEAEELIQEHTPEGEWLEQDILALSRPGIHIRPKVRHGLVVDEIAHETRSGNYDLVVIGAHQDTGWPHFLLDNLAHEIIARLDRPVLVVR